ncbi:hypothetical protein A2752_02920 [Candidatus Uhrbacteria bacterium RIFCSPHIGHO2_01_FULL_46_23]|nr:MAG: hypothetical protein A2752_02920 [Candidatus Uhrbacteria bacterium RIFCSPHIGHO2_01_FULL_46_23]
MTDLKPDILFLKGYSMPELNKDIWRPTRRDTLKLAAAGLAEAMVPSLSPFAIPSRARHLEAASFPAHEARPYPWQEYVQTIFVQEQPQNPDESLNLQQFAIVQNEELNDGRVWCRTEMSGEQVNRELSGQVYLPDEMIYRLSVRDLNPDNTCGATSHFQCDVVVGTQGGGVGTESYNRVSGEWFTRNQDGSSTFEAGEFVSTIGTMMHARIQRSKDDGLVSPDLVGKILFLNFGENISGGATENYPAEDTLPETTDCRSEATPIMRLNVHYCYRSPSGDEQRRELSLLHSAVGHEMIHLEHINTSFPPRLTEPFAASYELKESNAIALPYPEYVRWRKDLFDDGFYQNHTFHDRPAFDQEHYLWLDMVLQDEDMTHSDFWQRCRQVVTENPGEFCTNDEVDDIKVFEEIFGINSWISSRMNYLLEISAPIDSLSYTELLRSRREKMDQYIYPLPDEQMIASLGPGSFGIFSANMDEPNTSYVIRYVDSKMQVGAVVNGFHRSFIDNLELNEYAQPDGSLTFVVWNTHTTEGRAFEIRKIGRVRRRFFIPLLR